MDEPTKKRQILIMCPPESLHGGVAEYYAMFRRAFRSQRVQLSFSFTGRGANRKRPLADLIKAISDVVLIPRSFRGKDLIVINPSLDWKSLVRDGIYHLIAKRVFGKRTLVFFHAWFPECEKWIAAHGRFLFRLFFNFDRALVLSSRFKATLVQWGYPPQLVSVETMTYLKSEAEGDRSPLNMLFLARFTKAKGCWEALRAFAIVSRKYPARLFMAGDGELSGELRRYAQERGLSGIEFTGWVTGVEKEELLSKCGILLFPTTYGEGMPITVIEAMGMGLAIITCPVGGIAEIVTDGENGFLLPSAAPEAVSRMIERLLEDRLLWESISRNNVEKASRNFEVTRVMRRMEQILAHTSDPACACGEQ